VVVVVLADRVVNGCNVNCVFSWTIGQFIVDTRRLHLNDGASFIICCSQWNLLMDSGQLLH